MKASEEIAIAALAGLLIADIVITNHDECECDHCDECENCIHGAASAADMILDDCEEWDFLADDDRDMITRILESAGGRERLHAAIMSAFADPEMR